MPGCAARGHRLRGLRTRDGAATSRTLRSSAACGGCAAWRRGAVDNEGGAWSNVAGAHDAAHPVGARVAAALTQPAGIRDEALSGGCVYLGNETGALVLSAFRDQAPGLVAQDLRALGLER